MRNSNDIAPAIKRDARALKDKAKHALHRANVRLHRGAAQARARAREA